MKWRNGLLAAIVVLGSIGFVLIALKAVQLIWPMVHKAQVSMASIDRAALDLPDAVEAYRASGLPWEAKDVQLGPPVPDADNAAPTLNQAFSALNEAQFSKNEAVMRNLLVEGKYREVKSWLASFEVPVTLAEKAVSYKRVDFHRNWDLGPYLEFGEFHPSKVVVKILCMRAQVEAGEGDYTSACHDLACSFDLASLLGHEPTLLSALVAVALDQIACKGVVQCGAELKGNVPALILLRGTLSDHWREVSLLGGFRGEAYTGIVCARNFDLYKTLETGNDRGRDTPNINPAKLERSGLPMGAVQRAYLDRFLRAWTAVAALESEERIDPLKFGTDASRTANRFIDGNDVSDLLNVILLPEFSTAEKAVVSGQARYVATSALLAALIEESHTGRLPKEISQIPGKWVDPFNGTPLRVRATTKSIRIYSLGPCGKDLGGKDRSETKSQDYNIVAAYPPIN